MNDKTETVPLAEYADDETVDCTAGELRKLIAQNATTQSALRQAREALESCWQSTGEAYAGDCRQDKLLAANFSARAACAAIDAALKG